MPVEQTFKQLRFVIFQGEDISKIRPVLSKSSISLEKIPGYIQRYELLSRKIYKQSVAVNKIIASFVFPNTQFADRYF